MPDIHKLDPYQLGFINKKMLKISKKLEYEYLIYFQFLKVSQKKKFGMIIGTPPKRAHKLMAEKIFNYLSK